MIPIKETLNELMNERTPPKDRAKRLFPKHKKAQSVWVKLRMRNGGIVETVQTLDLGSKYQKYKSEYMRLVEDERHKEAAEKVAQFIKFCQQQILDNYHKFAYNSKLIIVQKSQSRTKKIKRHATTR